MNKGIIAAALLCAFSASAGADSVIEAPEVPDALPLTHRIEANLSLMSLELNSHLNRLSMDLMHVRFNARERRARFRLGSHGASFGLKLDSDIKFQGGYARIQATLDLKIAGDAYRLELPEIDYVPKSLDGDYLIRWPIIKGTF
jgi:hypothetical protein